MLTSPLFDFAVVILVQFLFFAVHSALVGERSTIVRHTFEGMMVGLPFGILFDLLVGKTFGFYEYELGFTLWFLALNGLFSFGFMFANIRLLYHHSLAHMYVWSVALAIVYEITNYAFPVWHWTFLPSPLAQCAAVVLVLYAGLTVLMMGVLRLLYKVHFRILPL